MVIFNSYVKLPEGIWDKDPRNLFKLKDVELHVPAQKRTHTHTHVWKQDQQDPTSGCFQCSGAWFRQGRGLPWGWRSSAPLINLYQFLLVRDGHHGHARFQIARQSQGISWNAVLGRKESPASPGKESLFMEIQQLFQMMWPLIFILDNGPA